MLKKSLFYNHQEIGTFKDHIPLSGNSHPKSHIC